MGEHYVFIYSFINKISLLFLHMICMCTTSSEINTAFSMPVTSNGSVLYFHTVYIMEICFIQTHILTAKHDYK